MSRRFCVVVLQHMRWYVVVDVSRILHVARSYSNEHASKLLSLSYTVIAFWEFMSPSLI